MAQDTVDIAALCALLRQASAAAAHEAMERAGHLSPSLSALVPGVLCVGPAHTVRAPAGYGDEIVRAADEAPPGSVIVIDVGPAPDACTWGDTGTPVSPRRRGHRLVERAPGRDGRAGVGGWTAGPCRRHPLRR